MALGYRLAFIRIDDRLRLILLFTKIIWKLVNYIALPLFLGGILEKVKAAFYDGDSKKSVIFFSNFKNKSQKKKKTRRSTIT